MAIQFNETTNNTGICQQARFFARVDSSQWPIAKIVNSANHWRGFLTGYAIAADTNFQWDNTEHTALPEGTMASTTSSDYSFLTDQQGNKIVNLIGVSRLDSATGQYIPLQRVDRNDPTVDTASFGTTTGTPTRYDLIADNVFRIDYKVSSVIAAYFKLFFQRNSPYYTASSTTETTGFSPLLDRGFVIAAAYDIAMTLGLPNLRALSIERDREEEKAIQYFQARNQGGIKRMTPRYESTK